MTTGTAAAMPLPLPLEYGSLLPERILRRIVPATDGSGCLLWTGSRDQSGYGMAYWSGQSWRVHRLAWALLVGPPPVGMHLDHVFAWGCRHRECCNVAHLEPVTPTVNTGRRPRRTTCLRGHPFTPENTRLYRDGRRGCRTCQRKYTRERMARRAAAFVAAGLTTRGTPRRTAA